MSYLPFLAHCGNRMADVALLIVAFSANVSMFVDIFYKPS